MAQDFETQERHPEQSLRAPPGILDYEERRAHKYMKGTYWNLRIYGTDTFILSAYLGIEILLNEIFES